MSNYPTCTVLEIALREDGGTRKIGSVPMLCADKQVKRNGLGVSFEGLGTGLVIKILVSLLCQSYLSKWTQLINKLKKTRPVINILESASERSGILIPTCDV